MSRRVQDVDAAGQNRDGGSAGGQRGAVRRSVDAVRSVACFELLMLTLADASASKRNQDVGNQAPNAGGGRA